MFTDPNVTLADLIGQPYTDENAEHIGGARVIRPGYAYTCDYQPFRLNVHLDENNIIISFNYG